MHPSLTTLDGMGFDHISPAAGSQHGLSMATDGSSAGGGTSQYLEMMGESAIDFNGMPTSAFSDPSSWGHFASMVTSGLGNFDTFWNNDSFGL
jgi:hypothetical protein